MTGRTLRFWLLGLAAALALAGGFFAARHLLAPATPSPADVAAAALGGLTLPDVEGHPQALAQWRGKVVVVNFWATWCAPCREEMPEFVKAQREFGPKGLQFVGIGVDDAAKLDRFAREIGLNYPTLVGGYGALELSAALGNTLMSLPFTIVLDRQGHVVHTQLGVLKPAKLSTILAQLL